MWYTQEHEQDHSFQEDLKSKIADPTRGIALYGTVPPPARLAEDKALLCAESVAQTVRELAPDAVIVRIPLLQIILVEYLYFEITIVGIDKASVMTFRMKRAEVGKIDHSHFSKPMKLANMPR